MGGNGSRRQRPESYLNTVFTYEILKEIYKGTLMLFIDIQQTNLKTILKFYLKLFKRKTAKKTLPIHSGEDNSLILSGSNPFNKKQDLLNSFSIHGKWDKKIFSKGIKSRKIGTLGPLGQRSSPNSHRHSLSTAKPQLPEKQLDQLALSPIPRSLANHTL